MDQQHYARTEESFRAFQQTRQRYSPTEVIHQTDSCDDIRDYNNVAAVLLYAYGACILEIEEGKSTQNGPFVSICRYVMPTYPLDILQDDDLEALERVMFNHYLDHNYFR